MHVDAYACNWALDGMVWRPVCPIFAPPVGAHDATYHQVDFNLLTKAGQRYEEDGDYQETPESDALVEQQDFINGYILGVIDSLGIPRQSNTSFSAETGTVSKLT